MRKLVITAFMAISTFSAYTQKFVSDSLTKKYFVEGIVNLDTIKKDVLFDKTNDWLVKIKYATTKGSKGIALSDRNLCKIIVKQHFQPSEKKLPPIWFTLTFNFKDGKFKYTYDNFKVAYTTASKRDPFEEYHFRDSKELKDQAIKDTENYITTSIDDLTQYLSNRQEDW
jgi:hypothetical protein